MGILHAMYMSPKRMSQLRELLSKNSKLFDSKKDNQIEVLGRCSKAAIKLVETGQLEKSLYRYLISIGTAFRRGNIETKNISYSLLNSLIEIEKIGKIVSHHDTRYIIFETIKSLRNQSDYLFNEYSLLWSDEVSMVNDVIVDLQESTKDNIERMLVDIAPELKALSSISNLSTNYTEKIKKLFDVINDEDEMRSTIALSALAYFYQIDDLIDDNAGIFGLADDLFVIENIYNKLFPEPVGNKLSKEFLDFDHMPLAMLVQKKIRNKNITSLEPISHHLQLILGSINFLEDRYNRLNLVLPETTIIIYLKIICDYLEQTDSQQKKFPREISPGDKRYFIRPNFALEFEYKGICELTKKPIISTSLDSSVIRVDKETLSSSHSNPGGRKKIISCGKKLHDYFNSEQDIIPPHIEVSNQTEFISILLTKKKNFDLYSENIHPFSINFKNLINMKYISKTDFFTDESLSENSMQLLVCSDGEVAIDILDTVDKPVKLYCDDANLANQLLSNLSDSDINKISQSIFVSGSKDIKKINQIEKRKFTTYTLDGLMQEFKAEKLSLKFNDTVSKSEIFYSKFTQKQNISKTLLNSDILSNYFILSKQIAKENITEKLGLEKLIFLLSSFRNTCLVAWYTQTELKQKEAQDKYDKLILELQYFSQYSEYVKELYKLVVNGKYELLNVCKLRDIKELITKTNGKIFILSQTVKDKHEATEKLTTILSENVEIISPDQLLTQYFDGTIILPSLQISKDSIQYLAQNRISEKLHLSLLKEELDDFYLYGRRSSLWRHNLENKTKKIFKNTVSSKNNTFFNELLPEKIAHDETLDEIEDDLYTEQLNKIDANLNKSGLKTDALLFTLDQRTNFIFLPPNSDVFVTKKIIGETNMAPIIFEAQTASNLTTGDTICIPQSGKVNLIEEIANHLYDDFVKIRKASTEWKIILRQIWAECDHDTTKLKEILEQNKINRTNTTLQKWLHDDDMIAPRNPIKNINILLKIPITLRSKYSSDEIISSIKLVYKMRQSATEHLLGLVNAKKILSHEKEFTISINGSSLRYSIHSVSKDEAKKTVSYSDLWQVKKMIEA